MKYLKVLHKKVKSPQTITTSDMLNISKINGSPFPKPVEAAHFSRLNLLGLVGELSDDILALNNQGKSNNKLYTGTITIVFFVNY